LLIVVVIGTGDERRGPERSVSLSSVDTDDNDDVAGSSQRRGVTDGSGAAGGQPTTAYVIARLHFSFTLIYSIRLLDPIKLQLESNANAIIIIIYSLII